MRITRRQLCGSVAGAYAVPWLAAQTASGTGPEKGQRIPHFNALDQHGVRRSFADLTGPNGLLLLFHRSADW